ncbi:MAG TPA: pyridoxamine 5'-phosphate oxidase [Acidimicrobiia bacterium]|jgi:pyridoxamine 5'-phosphate oxidase
MDDRLPATPRVEYDTAGIDIGDLDPDPFKQFLTWFREAESAGVPEPTAFVLATAASDARPSARAVLMKDFGPDGLVFYTNYHSRKGAELSANPQAAAAFVWVPLHRQVRLEGRVERVSAEQSDAYFASRPREAQLAAAASPQSQVVGGRADLEAAMAEVTAVNEGREVARPPHWGGWRLIPEEFEFWQGRLNRFHDRLLYRAEGDAWRIERLAP